MMIIFYYKNLYSPTSPPPNTIIQDGATCDNKEEETKTAVHEAGHVVVASILGRQIKKSYISGSKGGTFYYRKADKDMSLQDYLDEITINCSGRAAEVLVFNNDGGKTNYEDDEQHTKEEINKIFDKQLGDDYLKKRHDAKHQATSDILNECYNRAKNILIKNKFIWKIIVERLLNNKSLDDEGCLIKKPMKDLTSQRSWTW
ncbi:hypothetical protein [Candidatus Phytoplasma meliae]|uniref:Peptidase M41 domain-containing protein n=1 Tax=Candidatus Phytoplasma meliae TaxID=1848402 RepID=A0ABS5CY37_9MOLU|nr:hypothetical protein [Candidatus Phytoplasma meliae]MBP5835886.1 hypothetical protein [Candidatus Phytoplasma meliae]